jgi:integrase
MRVKPESGKFIERNHANYVMVSDAVAFELHLLHNVFLAIESGDAGKAKRFLAMRLFCIVAPSLLSSTHVEQIAKIQEAMTQLSILGLPLDATQSELIETCQRLPASTLAEVKNKPFVPKSSVVHRGDSSALLEAMMLNPAPIGGFAPLAAAAAAAAPAQPATPAAAAQPATQPRPPTSTSAAQSAPATSAAAPAAAPAAKTAAPSHNSPPPVNPNAPRNGKATVLPARFDGKPIAEAFKNSCWLTANAVVVHAAMRQIRNVPRQTPLARSFFDAAFLRAQGPAQLFPLIKRRRGKASDAVLSLRYIASRFVVADDIALRDLVAVGETPPSDVVPFAALNFVKGEDGPHWYALTRRNGTWTEHDAVERNVGRALPAATAYVWTLERPGGAKVACSACRGPPSSHLGKLALDCSKCHGRFFGACTGLNAREPPAGFKRRSWKCPTCAAQPALGSMLANDAPAVPLVPAAATPPAKQPQQPKEPKTRAPQQPAPDQGGGGDPPPQSSQMTPAATNAAFRSGRALPPHVAELPGDFLNNVTLLEGEPELPLARAGLAHATQLRHRNALRKLKEEAASAEPNTRLVALLERMYRLRSRARRWAAQTLHRELANVTGALSKLPLYSNAAWPVLLNQSPEWVQIMRATEQDAQKSQPVGQTAVALEEIREAIREAIAMAAPETAVALLLQWLTCARPGCTLQLRRRDVDLKPDGRLRVLFRQGKGVRFRGPYTVPTMVPQEHVQLLSQHLAPLRPDDFLFPSLSPDQSPKVRMAAMTETLRAINPELTLRAMRRGSLQALARAATPLDELLTFSGHTSEKTLKRYLDWGRLAEQRNAQAQRMAGVALW